MNHFHRYGVLTLAAVLASSCATPSIAPSGAAAPEEATQAAAPRQAAPMRHVQSVIECPESGDVTPKPGASSAPFEQVDKLPTGQAIHLDFKARKAAGKTPEADKIYFEDDTPFDVRFVEGPAFAVVDKDATDGTIVVQLPSGYYDTYLGTTGKPGGGMTVAEPTFFQQQVIGSSAGQDAWSRIGLRKLPLVGGYGEYRLHLEPKDVTGISGRWFAVPADQVPTPPVPPSPPQLSRLSALDSALPGEAIDVVATVTDPNGDPLSFTWTTTFPDGHVAADNPTGGATARWTAPFEAGSYQVSVTVEDPYFATRACSPLTITVPNLCPEAAVAGETEAQPGAAVALTGSASDGNHDALTWRWEGPAGTLAADGDHATFTAPRTAGTYTVKAVVSDGHGCETPIEHTVTVPNLCPEPTLALAAGGALPATVNAGAALGVKGTATDANGDTVTFSWTATGGALSPATGAGTTWTAPAAAGSYTLTGTADDGHGCRVPVSQTFTVLAPTPAPSPTPTPPGTVVKTYTLPYNTDRIGVGPDGNPWVTMPDADRVANLNKNGGVIGHWDAGGTPVDVAVTSSGNGWFTLETGYVRYMTAGTGATRQHLYVGSGLRDICVEAGGQTAYPAIAGENKVAVLFGTNAVYKWGTVSAPTGIDWSEDNKILVTVRGYGSQYIRKHEPGAFGNGKWVADYATGAGPQDIKVDRVNHRIWVVCEDSNVMTVLNSNGTRYTPDFSWRTDAVYNHTDLAVDRDGNGWIAMGSLMKKFSPTGQLLATFGPARGVTVDAEGYVWYTSGNKVYRMTP